MSVDPRISLASQTPDIGQTFSNALLNVQRQQQIGQHKQQAPFQNRLLEAQAVGAEQSNIAAEQTNDIRSLAVFGAELGPAIQAGDLFSITSLTQQRIQAIDQRGGNSKHSRELLAKLQDPTLTDQQKVDFTRSAAQQMNKLAVQVGAIKASPSDRKGSEQRAFEAKLDALETEKDPDRLSAIKRSLGLEARAIGSAAQTVATEGTAAAIGASEGLIAEGKERGTLKAKRALLPQLRADIKKAEIKAKEEGTIFTDLNRMTAALPGLKTAIEQLRELAPLVTSTFGGRVFDAAVKETGFGSTKGANARAKWIAIINNQVLPLLKPTFGGSFTVQEGEELKATMGSPDATPSQKMEQLDAFIAQKIRDIEGKQRELGVGIPQGLTDNGDGTFTTADGQILRRKKGG